VLYLRVIASMFLAGEPEVAHAASDTDTDDDETDADGEAADGADDDDAAPVHVRTTEVELFRPAMAAIMISAVVTIVLGVFPGVGGDVLRSAAESLINLK
ncbi:MAG: hypothetical protein AAF531_23540, partial [Actinomycetota bacterium]